MEVKLLNTDWCNTAGKASGVRKEENMKKPEMILFDYGQTLVSEAPFDGVKGTEAVLRYCTENKYHLTAEQIQREADAINHELGRFDPARRHLFQVEVPRHMFSAYLYESLGIRISLTQEEEDRIFWDAASPGKPTEGVTEFLDYLNRRGIRTGVVSNISYCGQVVEQRIRGLFPGQPFEFILATSEYMFRKPNERIFRLALEKAGLEPEKVWYIGDQYECDIVGAAGAGLFPVWYIGAIDLPYMPHEEVLTADSWEEIQRILDGAEAGTA